MPKIKDTVERRQKGLFAGRTAEIEQFQQWLKSGSPMYNIINYVGIGGIGKTTLLTMLTDTCIQSNIVATRVDVTEQADPLNVIIALWHQLQAKITTSEVDREIRRYLDIEKQLQTHRDIAPDAVNRMSKGALFGGMRYSTPTSLAPRTSDNADILRSIYTAISRDDADYFVDPQEKLTAALVKDMNVYLENKHICIMIDTYERISDSLDRWLVSLLPELEDLLILVIAGRDIISERWNDFELVTKVVELQEFELSDTRKLLALNGITSSEVAEQVHTITGGLPLGIKLCIQQIQTGRTELLKNADRATVVEEITKSLIRDVSPNLRDLLELCAALHWFNKDMLIAIEGNEPVNSLYEDIRKLPFIKMHTNGLTLHDRARFHQ
ncbi:MAG: hypothetical protein IPO91_23335 [Chloroflexi bacterium]|nr:hypothetical protein [Chloroflexota bacterium]